MTTLAAAPAASHAGLRGPARRAAAPTPGRRPLAQLAELGALFTTAVRVGAEARLASPREAQRLARAWADALRG